MADSTTSGNVTDGSSTGSTGGSSTGNIVSDVGGLLSATTPLASTALGLYDVSQAKQEYGQAASTLAGLGQPYVAAGQQQLTSALSGALTPAQQAQQNLYGTQAQTLYGQATPFVSAGTYDIQQSQAGQLPQWQQQQLENQKAASIAQATAALGPNADSSALANIINNINSQYNINQGNLAQQNLATGESLYNLGQTTQTQAMQAEQAAANVPVAAQQQAFANALNLAAGGNQPVEASVQTLLAGDQIIANELQAFMQALGTSGATGAIGNIGTAIGNLFGDIFGNSSG
jgi:hypothetical protein